MRTAIVLCAVLAMAGVATAEMIVDGDFEATTLNQPIDPSGTPSANYIQGTQGDVGVWYHSGAKWSIMAGGPAGSTLYADQGGWSDLKLMQSFAAPAAGTVLTLSGDYICGGAYQQTIYAMGLNAGDSIGLNGGGFIGGTELGSLRVDTTSTWSTFSFDATVDASYAEVAFVAVISGDSGTRGVDTVSVVPEPATMSILGLGALALIRRRR